MKRFKISFITQGIQATLLLFVLKCVFSLSWRSYQARNRPVYMQSNPWVQGVVCKTRFSSLGTVVSSSSVNGLLLLGTSTRRCGPNMVRRSLAYPAPQGSTSTYPKTHVNEIWMTVWPKTEKKLRPKTLSCHLFELFFLIEIIGRRQNNLPTEN